MAFEPAVELRAREGISGAASPSPGSCVPGPRPVPSCFALSAPFQLLLGAEAPCEMSLVNIARGGMGLLSVAGARGEGVLSNWNLYSVITRVKKKYRWSLLSWSLHSNGGGVTDNELTG